MSATQAPSGIATKPFSYDGFVGIDLSRDVTAQDTGRRQALRTLNNGYCDARGQIVRNPTATLLDTTPPITHLRFYAKARLCWAERLDGGLNFVSDRGHRLDTVYPPNAIVASTVFNRRAVFGARGLTPHRYTGSKWEPIPSLALANMGPAYFATIARRLAVAGIPGRETEIHISRADNEGVFPDDEDPASFSVLRAGYIDIANVLGRADQVSGLAAWEQNRIAIFTADQTIIYRLDPDIDNWVIDDRANITYGAASHNAIVSAGTDLVFPSRNGVHSIKRAAAAASGLVVFSFSMSEKIELLYRRLFQSVENPEQISAVWDQDESQYHLFFPQQGGALCTRLTLTINPRDEEIINWSTSTYLAANCGAFLAGSLVLGTPSGLYVSNKIESKVGEPQQLEFTTPILWHQDMVGLKQTTSLIVQASGHGDLEIAAFDELGRSLGTFTREVDADDDGAFPDVPLERQYSIPFEREYRGVQFRFRCRGKGLLRVTGLAVLVRT